MARRSFERLGIDFKVVTSSDIKAALEEEKDAHAQIESDPGFLLGQDIFTLAG